MTREFSAVAVVGVGTMGSGIVEVLARAGLPVVAVEKDAAREERARARVDASMSRAVARGKLSEHDRETAMKSITWSTDLEAVDGADLVIEAVTESLALKQEIFGRLDTIVGDDAVLATNTSSLSVTEIAVSTGHPKRVVGTHFFNPVVVQDFVEIVRTVVTEPHVVSDVQALVAKLGKESVVAGDKAGFIANALLFGYLNHAVSMYENRFASREDIDAAMVLGCGYPMGPLALIDLMGLDTAYTILDTMYRSGRDRLHAPAPLLKQMVTAGLLGRKSGRGFYTYESEDSSVVVPDAMTPAVDVDPAGLRTVEKVGVVGSGTMATGIVEVFAKAGYEVVFVARGDEKVAKVRSDLERSTEKAVLRGRLSEEDRASALARITGTSRLKDLAEVDLVVEAVIEELSVKQALFEAMDEICKPGAILATTTSSLPVVDCAVATQRPHDVVGLHFFNPAPVMKLVEVVRTVATADDVVDTAVALCRRLRKHPVTCNDRAGFIVNALLFPSLNDAVKMLEAHYATVDDIDTAMRVGCRLPMGPFQLLDIVGLDVSLAIQRTLYQEFREPGFAPAPLLEHLVTAGYLGRKAGKGFRDHPL